MLIPKPYPQSTCHWPNEPSSNPEGERGLNYRQNEDWVLVCATKLNPREARSKMTKLDPRGARTVVLTRKKGGSIGLVEF
jgi:hypothetical protein